MVLPLTHPVQNFVFGLDGLSSSKLTARNTLRSLDDSKFPGSQADVKMSADLGVGDLTHTSAQPVADKGAFVYNRLAFEVLVAGKSERFSDSIHWVNGLLVAL
jgi:hypothetical protein